MKVKHDSTQAKAVRPSVSGKRVSIFVPDDHRLIKLKRVLDWEAIKRVMIKHWRKAGKNVDGGSGKLWPTDLYAPLLVLMSVKTLDSRQMERDLEENAVSRLFIGIEDQLDPHVRDHSNIARAQDALGVEVWQEINELIVGQATRLGFRRS